MSFWSGCSVSRSRLIGNTMNSDSIDRAAPERNPQKNVFLVSLCFTQICSSSQWCKVFDKFVSVARMLRTSLKYGGTSESTPRIMEGLEKRDVWYWGPGPRMPLMHEQWRFGCLQWRPPDGACGPTPGQVLHRFQQPAFAQIQSSRNLAKSAF